METRLLITIEHASSDRTRKNMLQFGGTIGLPGLVSLVESSRRLTYFNHSGFSSAFGHSFCWGHRGEKLRSYQSSLGKRGYPALGTNPKRIWNNGGLAPIWEAGSSSKHQFSGANLLLVSGNRLLMIPWFDFLEANEMAKRFQMTGLGCTTLNLQTKSNVMQLL